MLHNVNLKIVNLNTLTLCLLFCNRMAPPTPHQLIPFLMWSTTTPFFYWTTRFHYVVGLSSLRRTYVERIFSSKTCRLINNENVVLQLVIHLFASCSFGTALVVLYSTDNNSIVLKPWSGCVTASLPRHGIWSMAPQIITFVLEILKKMLSLKIDHG